MKIVLSPTKTMMNSQFKIEDSPSSTPFFQKEAINIHQLLKGFSKQKFWGTVARGTVDLEKGL